MKKSESIAVRPARITSFLTNLALLILSAVFFALPQPNLISLRGFPLMGYVAFIPLFILIRRVSFRASFLWGAFYGLFSYCLFTYWLAVFHPVAMYVIGMLYFFYLMLAVPVLKLSDTLFPRYGFIVQWIVWVGYEYLKIQGYTGYSYGVIGYSQWSIPVIIQIASLFGVWGVSALVTFPSAWIAGGIKDHCTGPIRHWLSGFVPFAKKHALSAIIWCVALTGTIIFGIVSQRDYSSYEQSTVALVQPNSDPWQGGIATYRRDYLTLKRLSDKALAEHPEIDLVVWPETSFIPRIKWHYQYREDAESFELVSNLLNYLDSASVPFVLGNDDAIKGKTDAGIIDRIDYNAVFLFKPGENVIPPDPVVYWKLHLVPFTEYFPYRKQLPWVYDILVATDTHFWEEGTSPVVFEAAGLKFSTPICFEDTFGYLSRNFVKAGARAIVNLSNDAWANSDPCQYQHLSMAVFRAVENRVPLVRSTASGQTCVVDPNGRVVAMAPSSAETYLVSDIPVINDWKETLYDTMGDIVGILFACLGALIIVFGLLTKLYHMRDN